uniref:Uncharacterized protein n=1 Tax=Ananas comosus var. bracteatus TaxID=296719 RepID=A0A6V7QGV5_ANACO|nr:unnamed protein product [Ananas comosus var. bracteatus]
MLKIFFFGVDWPFTPICIHSPWRQPLSDSIAKRWFRLRRLATGQNLIDIDLAIAATYWELWKERNRRLFDNLQVRSDVLGRCIFETVSSWKSAFCSFGC